MGGSVRSTGDLRTGPLSNKQHKKKPKSFSRMLNSAKKIMKDHFHECSLLLEGRQRGGLAFHKNRRTKTVLKVDGVWPS